MVLEHSNRTHSGIQHQHNSWKGASCIWAVGEVTGNGVSAGQTPRNQAAAQSPLQDLPYTEPQSSEASCPTMAPLHTVYRFLLQGVKAAVPNTQK